MINPEDWIAPKDYKVFCFNGCAKYIMVCIGREKGDHPQYYFLNEKWELENINETTLKAPNDFYIEKPRCLEQLLRYAEKLSRPFPFVRVDFYVINEKVYFGELTFTPSAGLDANIFPDKDLLMGEQIRL